MTATGFRAWRARMGLDQADAADALGLTDRTIKRYESGDYSIPRAVALACLAIEAGLKAA